MKYKKGKKKNFLERDFELAAVVIFCSLFLALGGFLSRGPGSTSAENTGDVPDLASLVKLNGTVFTPSKIAESDIAKPEGNTKLQNLVNDAAAEDGTKLSIYVKDLLTGEQASFNATSTFKANGLEPLFIPSVAQYKSEQAQVNYQQIVDTGRGLSLKQCIGKMFEDVSDQCTTKLQDLFKDDLYYDKLSAIGYKSSFLGKTEEKATSAADSGLALEKIFKTYSEKNDYKPAPEDPTYPMLRSSDQSLVLSKLPLGVQSVYYESSFDGYLNSSAIVYTDTGPVLVSILSGQWDRPNEDSSKISEIYKKIYEFY